MALILGLAAACALIYLPLASRPASVPRTAFKTTSVALLACGSALAGLPWLLTLALALCAIGDALLAQDNEQSFMAGVGAFAAGHLAYVALFLGHPNSDTAQILQSPLALAALAALGLVMAVSLAPRAGALRGPVLAYIPVILAMGVAVLSLPNATAQLAALAFVASDTVLASEKFLLPDDHPARRVTPWLVWPLYWGAQAGFVLAFA
ncbi:lysoplasmalogenase family protein [Lutimaribacter marinistellae]|uniref:Lysoplasmalogenase family protein n=1 Tax=Lutimaribacter marinistellae TaxID=1820329 RepID=A0ABV7TJZ6_9RHOB